MQLSTLLGYAGDIITAMIGWIGTVIGAIFNPASTGTTDGTWASIAPFLFIGLGITLILTSVGVVRSFIAGRSM